MASKQAIVDRLRELDDKAFKAGHRARQLEEMAQRAERQDLQRQCGTTGHAVSAGYFNGIRTCAICGAQDAADLAKATAIKNMARA